jgi:hypothetical protein
VSDIPARRPIEPHVRGEEPPDDAVLVLRGGPLTAAKLLEHALREQRRFSYRGLPMPSVSVDATVGGWTVDTILERRLWTRTSYAATTVARLRQAGYVLLPTFDVPHYDLLLPAASEAAASTLLSVFGPAERNPYRRRR